MKYLWIVLLVILVIVSVGCTEEQIIVDSNNTDTSEDDSDVKVIVDEPTIPIECEVDADCVKASCCHASSCVAVNEAPSCEGLFCTSECAPGTLDCGGACYCNEGKCAAILNDKEFGQLR